MDGTHSRWFVDGDSRLIRVLLKLVTGLNFSAMVAPTGLLAYVAGQ